MSNRFFDDIRAQIQRNQIEQVLPRLGNAVEGERDNLGPVADIAIQLARRFSNHELERVSGTATREELNRDIARIAHDLLGYVTLLENRWTDLPQPAVGPPAEALPISQARPDWREALLPENPLRRVAWLHRGLELARAICRIRTPRNSGTGFLIGGGRIITNNHVIQSADVAEKSVAIFNYEEDFRGVPLVTEAVEFEATTLKTNPDKMIDCTVVQLKASPEQLKRWGHVELNCDKQLPESSGVSIIQHPDGGPKQIAIAGNTIAGNNSRRIDYHSSTMAGSSGAPVFDDGWRVVALHQGAGGWSEKERRYMHNTGIRFSAIAADPLMGPAIA